MKYFSWLLSGYWASYRIQLKVGNINLEWLQCVQHFVKCPTDIFSLHFTAMLWEGSSYIICICRKGSWKSKMLIRTSQLFHVLEHLECSVSVAYWGKWLRMLAVRGICPKVPGRPGSGQICNLFTARQCAYNGICMLSLPVGFSILSFWNHQFMHLAVFPPKEKFIFSLLIHKTSLGMEMARWLTLHSDFLGSFTSTVHALLVFAFYHLLPVI